MTFEPGIAPQEQLSCAATASPGCGANLRRRALSRGASARQVSDVVYGREAPEVFVRLSMRDGKIPVSKASVIATKPTIARLRNEGTRAALWCGFGQRDRLNPLRLGQAD